MRLGAPHYADDFVSGPRNSATLLDIYPILWNPAVIWPLSACLWARLVTSGGGVPTTTAETIEAES